MDNNYSNELQHWGVKGQKWGQRRYQYKDGTLTPAGKKRYNKEVEKLKAEEAKIKTAEKIAANRQKTQNKIDKLDAKKQELEERKKALKAGKQGDKENDKPEETIEERREKALKSTDPKEIYKNKDVLTYQELNERVNRIDLEARLQNRIPADPPKQTMMDKVDSAAVNIGKATNLYRKVDEAVTTVANSTIGKTLASQLGIELPKKSKDYDKMLKNLDKLDTQDMMDLNKRELAKKSIKRIQEENKKEEADRAEAARKSEQEKAAKEQAKKDYDDFQERLRKGEIDNEGNKTTQSEPYSKKGSDIVDNVTYTRDRDLPAVVNNIPVSAATNTKSYDTGKNYVSNNISKVSSNRVSDSDVEIIEPEWVTKMRKNGML